MLSQPVLIVIFQYVIQALLALVIMLILRKFYKQYQNNFFKFWSLSWLALFITMLASSTALTNAFYLPLEHPFRLFISFLSVYSSFLQMAWLYAGTREISRTSKVSQNYMRIYMLASIPVCAVLVMIYYQDPSAGDLRIFYRIGIKSLLAGGIFIACALMLLKISKAGIGIRFIIFSFIAYGLLQLNYFIVTLCEINGINYGPKLPFFMGAFDLFLQSLMGLGMIISVLEIEQLSLKKANTELDTFLYRSSHDLRSPLTTISGIVEAIRHADDEKKVAEFLSAIEERVQQADNVIRDIITLRKAQKADLIITKIDLVEEIYKEYNFLLDPNDVQPKLAIDSELVTIHTDSARLHTVLTNIIGNAIKYHNRDHNTEINIKIQTTEKGVELKISDNGAGIDEKHLPKIFDMFYRATKTSTGTGLGLYLVKDALDHMGGSIEVFSQKGKGTTFYIYLPDLIQNQ